jgi:hypothetical protein
MGNPSDKEFERLKLLFDYTKFHILLYTTLITLLIGLFAFGGDVESITQFRKVMKPVVVCFLIAGAAGGVIASNIPKFDEFSIFWDGNNSEFISPFGCKFFNFPGKIWASIEHSAFWIGILIAISSFLRT